MGERQSEQQQEVGRTTSAEPSGAQEPLRYPTDHVVGVLDTVEQVEDVVGALTSGGFLASEIQVATGTAAADRLRATTGRTGLADLAIRIAERLGIADDEMNIKSRHEQALRDGKYVILVSTPTEERRELAAQFLRARGAHTLVHMGRFTITGYGPPEPA